MVMLTLDMFIGDAFDCNYKIMKSAEDDVIDRDEQQFDDIADSSHDGEPEGAGSRNLFEF